MAHVRERQIKTFGTLVSEVSDSVIRESIEVTDGAKLLLGEAVKRIGMSARGYVRVLRVARTIADLEERSRIDEEIVAEAVSYRTLDRLTNLIHSGRTMSVGGMGGVTF